MSNRHWKTNILISIILVCVLLYLFWFFFSINSFTSLKVEGIPDYIRDRSFYFLHKERYNILGYKVFLSDLKNQFDNSDFYKIKSINHTNLGKVDVVFYIPDYLVKATSDNNFYDLEGNVVANVDLNDKKIIHVNKVINSKDFFNKLQGVVFYSLKYGFVPSFIFFYDDIIKFKDRSTSIFEFNNDENFDEKFKEIFDFLQRFNNKKWPKEIILLDERRLVIKK